MSEQARLERRRLIARQAVNEYEDQLSNHELVLIRLDSLPESLREPNHDDARAQTEANVERLRVMVEAMRAESGPEPNRAERRKNGKR